MQTKNFYSIGETAKMAGTTIETLRHYDRIGLLKPAKVDPDSNYRYYTETELIYLEVISFCRRNKMSLKEIQNIVNADFTVIVPFLKSAGEQIDNEIKHLKEIKSQISNLHNLLIDHSQQNDDSISVKLFEQRAILLAKQLNAATLENFHSLHESVLQTVPLELKSNFCFDNSANFLVDYPVIDDGIMFAVCVKFSPCSDLQFLKAGKYLCCKCTDENRHDRTQKLLNIANKVYHITPQHIILNVVFTGLFNWQYEIQIPLF